MINQVVLTGRLSKEVDLKTDKEQNIANFVVAVKNHSKDKDNNTDFFYITAFGKVAEIVKEHASVGCLLNIVGRLSTYKNKDNKTEIRIIANEIYSYTTEKKVANEEAKAEEDK